MKLPTWMRAAMIATAVMNVLGAILFLPVARTLREMSGLPEAHPFYLSFLSALIFILGVAYLWSGITARVDRLFIAVAAAGKLAFGGLILAFIASGLLEPNAIPSAGGDLLFGALFTVWLVRAPRSASHSVVTPA